MKLSDRLETIIEMVRPCNTAADIGCDHGFTAIRLVEDGIAEHAICSDIGSGPLQRAAAHIREQGLADRIECREGDGLSTVAPEEADCIIIAGMGGKLMRRILLDGVSVLSGVEQLILSPHTDIPEVRRTLQELHFRIDAERMVLDLGKYYTVIRAVPGEMQLSPEEAEYGPCLLRDRSDVFLSWLSYEIGLQQEVLSNLRDSDSQSADKVRRERKRKLQELKTLLEAKMIHVIINEERYEYPEGTSLQYIAEDMQSDYSEDIVLAFVNGRLRELFHRVPDGARLDFVTTGNKIGAETYQRSVIFLMLCAFRDVYGPKIGRQLFVDYQIGNGLFVRFSGGECTDEMLDAVSDRMMQLVRMDIPFRKESVPTKEAVRRFQELGLEKKSKLFSYRRASETNIYHLGEMQDYYFAYMVPSTGYLRYFRLQRYDGSAGFILQTPSFTSPKEIRPYEPHEKLYLTMESSTAWSERLKISCAGDLNDWITNAGANELVLIQEAIMEKRFGDIAEKIAESGKKIVLIAGPSSSGKTTFSHRLSVQLRALGLRPHPIACDNYFLDRDSYPLDENGKADFEAITCIDIELLNQNFSDLLAGKTVLMPSFNFVSGKQEFLGNTLQISDGDVIILEGIHCLNDSLTYALPEDEKFRIYISALTTLNIDEHNCIPPTDVRLLRRIVRDARTRGNTAQSTIARWDSVRAGEERNIFPWQETADVMVNSALIYELPVLKAYAEPLLFCVPEDSPEYLEAKRLLKFLDYFLPVPTEEIPRNSIVREFIGGGCFGVG